MNLLKPFFKDHLNRELSLQGFTRFPFLTESEVQDLNSFADQSGHRLEGGFHATLYHVDVPFRRSVNSKIQSVFGPKLKQILKGFDYLYGNFMIKEPGPGSEMKIHQDWAYVDERRVNSLAIWVPLSDLSFKNGALCVFPGSHRVNNPIRGFGVLDPLEPVHDYLKKEYMEVLDLKAGEAVIWDHRLAHCSPPNLSHNPRVACTAILVPEDEPVIHFFRHPDDPIEKVEKFEADPEFFLHYELGRRPDFARSLGFEQNTFPVLGAPDLDEIIGSAAPPSAFQRLKEKIKTYL